MRFPVRQVLLSTALILGAIAAPALAAMPTDGLVAAAKAGVPVVVPVDLPPGTVLVRSTVSKNDEGTSYTAFYRVGKGPVGFAIESAAGGIGDLISDREPVAKVQAKRLGSEPVGLYWHLSGMTAKTPRSWYTEWITAKAHNHAYRLAGVAMFEPKDRAAWGAIKDVEKAWAVRICNSLAPWKPAKP